MKHPVLAPDVGVALLLLAAVVEALPEKQRQSIWATAKRHARFFNDREMPTPLFDAMMATVEDEPEQGEAGE